MVILDFLTEFQIKQGIKKKQLRTKFVVRWRVMAGEAGGQVDGGEGEGEGRVRLRKRGSEARGRESEVND